MQNSCEHFLAFKHILLLTTRNFFITRIWKLNAHNQAFLKIIKNFQKHSGPKIEVPKFASFQLNQTSSHHLRTQNDAYSFRVQHLPTLSSAGWTGGILCHFPGYYKIKGRNHYPFKDLDLSVQWWNILIGIASQ